MDVQKVEELKTRISRFPDDHASYLEVADIFIGAGQYQDAYNHLKDLAEHESESVDILSTTGALAVRLEKYDEALRYLEKASTLSPLDKNIFHNIGLLHATREELPQAEAAFRKVLEIDPNDAQGLNDLAVVLAHRKKTAEARRAFEDAIRKNPAFEKAHENFAEFCLEERLYEDGLRAIEGYCDRVSESARLLRWKRAFEDILESSTTQRHRSSGAVSTRHREHVPSGLKIAFFATQDSFAEGILRNLSGHNEIRRFAGETMAQMGDLMRWADIAWFEWCDKLLIEATRLPKNCPIICRLHSYEAFTDMPAQVDWSKVDKLILVNHNVSQVLERLHSIPVGKEIIYNGVDLNKFTIHRDKTYGRKLCSLGYINYKKNPALLLYCFKAIHNWDPQFEFHVAGRHQDPRISLYMEHLLRRLAIPVRFDGWVEDVPGYLKDKDFVISTSLFESFHYSIAEGMASGVLPLVHSWPGSENIYPGQYLFDTPDDCVELVKRLMKSDRRKLAEENRAYIAKNFSLEKTIQGFNRVIETVRARAGVDEAS